jgi:hypothetical protein
MLARRHEPMVAAWHPGAAQWPEALYCVTPWTDPSDRCHSGSPTPIATNTAPRLQLA